VDSKSEEEFRSQILVHDNQIRVLETRLAHLTSNVGDVIDEVIHIKKGGSTDGRTDGRQTVDVMALSLGQCIEIIRSTLDIDSTKMPIVIKEALKVRCI
jgi:hypothetical protein